MRHYITYCNDIAATYCDGDDLMLHYETTLGSPEWQSAVKAGGDICVCDDGDGETDIVISDRDLYRAITGE